MKKFLTAAAAALLISGSAAELKIDFKAAQPWQTLRNHAGNVKFEHKEYKGKKATLVTLSAKPRFADTAFSLGTNLFPVKGKKSVNVKFSFIALKGMKDFKGGGYWCNAVRFYDGAQKEIAPIAPITLPPATGAWQQFSVDIPVPANAATALVHFGFDNPNITKDNFFAISDVAVSY